MNSKIYVGNLSYDTENSELETLFSTIGAVSSVNVIKDRDTGRARGFGFIEMESPTDTEKAITNLHDKDFKGRNLVVNLAKSDNRKSFNPRY
ncbi:MAG: RNA-binding protein [Halobacteriovoraceae bacterium]|nr:RNA-binding protein [Halobacteriovoraceae bacterium]|tara:strand:+ start:35632 stop:35907 length:276 start_codon:yes stop_codon:yes gene_type:complete